MLLLSVLYILLAFVLAGSLGSVSQETDDAILRMPQRALFLAGMYARLPEQPLSWLDLYFMFRLPLSLPRVGFPTRLLGTFCRLTIPRRVLYSIPRCNPTGSLSLPPQVLYGCGGKGLGANMIFMVAMSAWVSVLAYAGLIGIKYVVGLRVTMAVEEMGMDKSRHVRHHKGNVALRRALRSAAGKEDRSAGSSHRPSFKSSHPGSPRHVPARPTLSHWKE